MNRITMTFSALALIAVISVAASSQTAARSGCNLTEAGAPAVRGLRLGMSAEQLLRLFPESTKKRQVREALEKAKAPDGEPVYAAFEPADGNKEQFTGVAGISVVLANSRVIEFTIQYLGPDWNSIDEWVATLAQSLNLPDIKAWKIGPAENPNRVLTCNGFEIEATIQGGGGAIRMQNAEYRRAAQERAGASEEKKKRDYKP